MNWLTNFVRPKLRGLVRQKEVPDNLWIKCPGCGQMVFHRELDEAMRVCPHCGHHMKLDVSERLKMLFDDGAYKEIELPETLDDPLKFKDRRKYTERLKEARNKRGRDDCLIVAHGTMGGSNVVIAAFDFAFMGGSMGVAVGEAFVAAGRLAVVQDATLIVIPSSGGARMQEGILSLMQMARTTVAVEEVRDAGLPYITVLTDPTTGGVSASFAMLGDVSMAEPGAVICFAGARVIEQTIRQTLPEGFQRAEFLLEHGMLDMVVPRTDMRDTLISIIDVLRNRGPVGDLVTLTPRQKASPLPQHPVEQPAETEEKDAEPPVVHEIPIMMPPPDIAAPKKVDEDEPPAP